MLVPCRYLISQVWEKVRGGATLQITLRQAVVMEQRQHGP